MSEHEMLDDVNLKVLEAHDARAYAAAGYVNGRFANWAALVQHYKGSAVKLISITVTAETHLGAQCLDIETGDAKPSQAPAWVKVTRAEGIKAKDQRYYPKVYCSAGMAATVIGYLTNAGIKRDEYMLWSAHYTGKAHICGPKTCGYPQADATQWTDHFQGASLDASDCYGYFFAGPPKPKPVVPPEPPKPVVVPPVVVPPIIVPPPPPVVPTPAPPAPEPTPPPAPAPPPAPTPPPAPVPPVVVPPEVLFTTKLVTATGPINVTAGTILFIPQA